jgi:hypothetical protein
MLGPDHTFWGHDSSKMRTPCWAADWHVGNDNDEHSQNNGIATKKRRACKLACRRTADPPSDPTTGRVARASQTLDPRRALYSCLAGREMAVDCKGRANLPLPAETAHCPQQKKGGQGRDGAWSGGVWPFVAMW